MITNLRKLENEGKEQFIINDSVILREIYDDGTVDIEYNEKDLTEQEAIDLVNELLRTIVDNIKNKEK